MNYCITNAGREREGGRVAVAEETDDYLRYREYGGVGWRAGARYTDPLHPLADMSLESLPSMCDDEDMVGLEAFMRDHNKNLFEYMVQVFKKHGCTRKEIATALGIDTRTLNQKLHHPEELTADEVNVICETAHCELGELRKMRSADESAMDAFPTLSDLHRKIVREIIQDFKMSEVMKALFLAEQTRHQRNAEK